MSPSYSQVEYTSVTLLNGIFLEVVVKSKKAFVAATNIKLDEKLLNQELWFPLGNSAIWPQSCTAGLLPAGGATTSSEGPHSWIWEGDAWEEEECTVYKTVHASYTYLSDAT